MQSDILSINQMNTFQYAISSSLRSKPTHLFAQKIYGSKTDGFDQQEFDKKCSNVDHQLVIAAKTNQNHTFCYHLSKNYFSDMHEDIGIQSIGCLLESPILTIPVLYNPFDDRNYITYHYPNDFEANRMHRLSDIVVKYKRNSFVDGIEYPQAALPSKTDKFCITHFEVFIVQ